MLLSEERIKKITGSKWRMALLFAVLAVVLVGSWVAHFWYLRWAAGCH